MDTLTEHVSNVARYQHKVSLLPFQRLLLTRAAALPIWDLLVPTSFLFNFKGVPDKSYLMKGGKGTYSSETPLKFATNGA